MNEPKRSTALKRALAAESDGLPEDFAVQVSQVAEAQVETRRSKWSDATMLGAFVAMIGVCVTGWFGFVGSPEIGNAELMALICGTLASQPWLVIGVAGVVAVQVLTLLRRVAT